jgi:beta-glucosidase
VTADPRLLARFDGKAGQWRIVGGTYKVVVAKSAVAPVLTGEAQLHARLFGN